MTVRQKHRVDVRRGNSELGETLAARLTGVDKDDGGFVPQNAGGEELAGHGRTGSGAEKLERTHRGF
jgi:hypothetical protein